MKKSVVILIALIYVTSIAAVSFFGLQFKIFDEVISVERIEILGAQDGGEGVGNYVIITPNAEGEYKYQIDYRVYPDNATNNKVDFATDPNITIKNYSVDENGVVTIDKPGVMATIFVVATDGSHVETTIKIISAAP